MTTDSRDLQAMCLHALNAFEFLKGEGYQSIRESSSNWFKITFTSEASPIAFTVGAWLTRYEYSVSVDRKGCRLGLDEVASVLESPTEDRPDWTWAHSAPAIFREHVDHSAQLLRRHFHKLVHEFDEVHQFITKARSAAHEAEQLCERIAAADAAFAEGRWRDAFEGYQALPALTQLQSLRMRFAQRRT